MQILCTLQSYTYCHVRKQFRLRRIIQKHFNEIQTSDGYFPFVKVLTFRFVSQS